MGETRKRYFYGIDLIQLDESKRPPYIYVGVHKLDGTPIVSFYVNSKLDGPYWPDDHGNMILKKEREFTFSRYSMKTVYRRLNTLADMMEGTSNGE
jgi:hypothetical protein